MSPSVTRRVKYASRPARAPAPARPWPFATRVWLSTATPPARAPPPRSSAPRRHAVPQSARDRDRVVRGAPMRGAVPTLEPGLRRVCPRSPRAAGAERRRPASRPAVGPRAPVCAATCPGTSPAGQFDRHGIGARIGGDSRPREAPPRVTCCRDRFWPPSPRTRPGLPGSDQPRDRPCRQAFGRASGSCTRALGPQPRGRAVPRA